MKLWYHVVAAVTGLAIAALIVYLVFGNASQEGATQEGSAGSLSAAGTTLCGTISPAEATSQRARALAGDNQPSLFSEVGPIAAISDNQPDQQAWVNRVHAASGLCIDELRIERVAGITIAMSTVEDVDAREVDAFAAGAIAQAFTPPFNPTKVTLRVTVGGSERVAVVSRRAWQAYQIRREAVGVPHSMHALVQFRQATSFAPADLRLVGWR